MQFRPKILIVDDNTRNLIALEEVLKETDSELLRAQNGNEALKATLNHEFALAILDVQMPGMNGYELAEHLRGVEKTRRLPVIFLTAVYRDESHMFKGYRAGAVDFITKPYNPEILRGKVNTFLALDRQVQEIQQAREELRAHRDHLDELVRERTIALTETNERLRKEIGERRLTEEALREKTAALERSNMELEHFAHVASHDLQEPLRKIIAFGDRLKMKCADSLDDRGRDYISRMHNAALRMRNLIESLLEFSRVTTHARPFQQTDLNRVLAGVLSDLELKIAERQAEIEVGALPTIEADSRQMGQLFQNLISNALKFHREGVPLEIKIGHQDLGPDGVRLTVRDNGIGFDMKYLDRILKPFQRLHTKSEFSGVGIGLSICSKIVQYHRGTLQAESLPGEGAAFIITLPRS